MILASILITCSLVLAVDDAKVFDPSYHPRIGERVSLARLTEKKLPIETWCAKSALDFKNYLQSLMINDRDGTHELLEKGDVFHVKYDTQVLILEFDTFKIDGPKPGYRRAALVRFLESDHAGEKGWVTRGSLASLVSKTIAEESKPTDVKGYAIDFTYAPKVGTKITVGTPKDGTNEVDLKDSDAVGAISLEAYRSMEWAEKNDSIQTLHRLYDKGELIDIECGRVVKVIQVIPGTVDISQVLQVEIIGGHLSGQRYFISPYSVVNLISQGMLQRQLNRRRR
jgi:hypothetical protein